MGGRGSSLTCVADDYVLEEVGVRHLRRAWASSGRRRAEAAVGISRGARVRGEERKKERVGDCFCLAAKVGEGGSGAAEETWLRDGTKARRRGNGFLGSRAGCYFGRPGPWGGGGPAVPSCANPIRDDFFGGVGFGSPRVQRHQNLQRLAHG